MGCRQARRAWRAELAQAAPRSRPTGADSCAGPDGQRGRRCEDRARGHQEDQGQAVQRHGRRGLRHGGPLRPGCFKGSAGRRVPNAIGIGVRRQAEVRRAGPDSSSGRAGRSPEVEEGVGLPPTGCGWERLLQVQGDVRRPAPRPASIRREDRGDPRVQDLESAARPCSVYRSLKSSMVGDLRAKPVCAPTPTAIVRSCTQRCAVGIRPGLRRYSPSADRDRGRAVGQSS